MSEMITWEEINNFNYFVLGLQPCFKETHKPIPCPKYCHEFHILLNTARYTHINSTREKLKEWEIETKKNKTISICLTHCPNLLLYLIRSCGNTLSKFNIMNNISVEDKKSLEAIMVQGVDRNNEQKLKAALIQKFGEKDDRLEKFQKILYNDPDNINLTLEDVRKLEVVLDQESVKDNERSKKLDEIIKNDPDRNSWISFQMPNSEEKGKELYDLLSEAVFDKEQVDKIREKSSGKNQLSKLSDLEDELNEELKKIYPELERFFNALKEEIDLGDYGVEDSINEIGAAELHKIALDYFDRAQNEYKLIKKPLVQKESLYTFSGNRRRMLIRNILQEYLKGHPAMNNKKIHTSKEALHNRYNRINGLT